MHLPCHIPSCILHLASCILRLASCVLHLDPLSMLSMSYILAIYQKAPPRQTCASLLYSMSQERDNPLLALVDFSATRPPSTTHCPSFMGGARPAMYVQYHSPTTIHLHKASCQLPAASCQLSCMAISLPNYYVGMSTKYSVLFIHVLP
ncbi:hypothetical protein K504DRAFT_296243 [Pleomassaria siparia CBS 279.74]|uniref:Uncharacterized protein n=1 Tax=Pleomassaria siparia CBS 279.74 TaxID=1314801 RepID=A0A6G1K5T4_9PLEO|nr:hypothetical protein K504DRAFT_296243 [Pleomassaria siparia CBS 279.74]